MAASTIHVSGTVTNGTVPLGGAAVTAIDASGLVVGAATTNPDGTYVIDSLTPGTYTISAGGAGYLGSATQLLTVADGANITGVTFTVTAVAIADPPPIRPDTGPGLSLLDQINNLLLRPVKLSSHPNEAIDLELLSSRGSARKRLRETRWRQLPTPMPNSPISRMWPLIQKGSQGDS